MIPQYCPLLLSSLLIPSVSIFDVVHIHILTPETPNQRKSTSLSSMKGAALVIITLVALSSTRAFSPQHVHYSVSSSNSLPSSFVSSQTSRSFSVTTSSIHQLHDDMLTLSSPSYQHMLTKNKHHDRIKYRNIILFSSTSSDDSTSNNEDTTSSQSPTSTTTTISKVDEILSNLTSLFPLFVLGSAILGSYVPQTLNWVNNGNLISIMLAG